LGKKIPTFISDKLSVGEDVLMFMENGQPKGLKAYLVATNKRLLRVGRDKRMNFAIFDYLEYNKNMSINYTDVRKRANISRFILLFICLVLIALIVMLYPSPWIFIIGFLLIFFISILVTIGNGYYQISDPHTDIHSNRYEDKVKWQIDVSPFTSSRAMKFTQIVREMIIHYSKSDF